MIHINNEKIIVNCHNSNSFVRLDAIVDRSGHHGNGDGNPVKTAWVGRIFLVLGYWRGKEHVNKVISNKIVLGLLRRQDTLEENLFGKGRNKTDETDPQGRKNTLGFPTFPAEDSEEGHFYHGILKAVQKWFSLYGWPKGSHPISVPQSLRSAVCKVQTSNSPHRKASYQVSHGKDTKTIYDMLFHLSGQMLPGITVSQSLPFDLNERVLQLHWQHSTLLTFLKAEDTLEENLSGKGRNKTDETDPQGRKNTLGFPNFPAENSEKGHFYYGILKAVQKWSGLYGWPKGSHPISLLQSLRSTIGLVALLWIRSAKNDGLSGTRFGGRDIPPGRWIINFDLDFLDGLVLAAVLAANCPFLISTRFLNMYTNPTSLEQCLHNSLVLVNSFRAIGLDIDIQRLHAGLFCNVVL
ncbi:UNVERIFIED_CONTAM: hypothetical protein FKN15_061278 [Acipenser sinensis]